MSVSRPISLNAWLSARIEDALAAEKRIKRWRRQWKIELIEKANPDWWDQASDLL